MTDRLDIGYCASAIAAALFRALKDGHVAKVDIDDVRAAVIGYLAAGPYFISKPDTGRLIDTTLRKLVEKVG